MLLLLKCVMSDASITSVVVGVVRTSASCFLTDIIEMVIRLPHLQVEWLTVLAYEKKKRFNSTELTIALLKTCINLPYHLRKLSEVSDRRHSFLPFFFNLYLNSTTTNYHKYRMRYIDKS